MRASRFFIVVAAVLLVPSVGLSQDPGKVTAAKPVLELIPDIQAGDKKDAKATFYVHKGTCSATQDLKSRDKYIWTMSVSSEDEKAAEVLADWAGKEIEKKDDKESKRGAAKVLGESKLKVKKEKKQPIDAQVTMTLVPKLSGTPSAKFAKVKLSGYRELGESKGKQVFSLTLESSGKVSGDYGRILGACLMR